MRRDLTDLDGIKPLHESWGQTPVKETANCFNAENAEGQRRRERHTNRRRTATSRVLFGGCRSGSHEQPPERQSQRKIRARCGTDSFRMSSPLRLSFLCVLCVKAVPCVSAFLRFCGESCSQLFTRFNVSLSHAKRCIRADPFNPSNPRPKLLMPTSQVAARAPIDPSLRPGRQAKSQSDGNCQITTPALREQQERIIQGMRPRGDAEAAHQIQRAERESAQHSEHERL
jgi:hypothetical protein